MATNPDVPRDPQDTRIKWVHRWHSGLCGFGEKMTNRLAWNLNTGCAAVNLALRFGAKHIVLLGFDMSSDVDEKGLPRGNWHPNLVNSPDSSNYIKYMEGFERVAAELRNRFPDVRVYNATPGSAMKTFPIITPEQSLCIQ
jgi:hypothetical protein